MRRTITLAKISHVIRATAVWRYDERSVSVSAQRDNDLFTLLVASLDLSLVHGSPVPKFAEGWNVLRSDDRENPRLALLPSILFYLHHPALETLVALIGWAIQASRQISEWRFILLADFADHPFSSSMRSSLLFVVVRHFVMDGLTFLYHSS